MPPRPAHPRPRAARSRRGVRGQVMLLFALMLPVLLGFVALSMAASSLLNARNKLDHTTLAAAIGASSDSCMVSSYAFDLYKCQNPAAQPSYAAHAGWADSLPQPAFTSSGSMIPAVGTICSDASQCVGSSDGTCSPSPCDEHSAAQASADTVVAQVLQANYPGYTVTNCPLPATASTCAGLVSSTNIEYQVWVSYWYYYDTDDQANSQYVPPSASSNGSAPVATQDKPSDDGGGNLTSANGGLPVTDNDGDLSTNTSNLLCPATFDTHAGSPTFGFTKFVRSVTVVVWTEYSNPFSGILGIGASGMRAAATTAGCSA